MTPSPDVVRQAAQVCSPVHDVQPFGPDYFQAIFQDGRRVAVSHREIAACSHIGALVDLIDTRRTFARSYQL